MLCIVYTSVFGCSSNGCVKSISAYEGEREGEREREGGRERGREGGREREREKEREREGGRGLIIIRVSTIVTPNESNNTTNNFIYD